MNDNENDDYGAYGGVGVSVGAPASAQENSNNILREGTP